jgi:putative redox protein
MPTMILANVTVNGEHGYAQSITTSAHVLKADEPQNRGGTNTGPSPSELMLASLGACTAITLRMYSERKEWDLGNIQVKLRLLKDGEEQKIERRISLSGDLGAAQIARLLDIADKTPVTRALAPGVPIQTLIDAPTRPT